MEVETISLSDIPVIGQDQQAGIWEKFLETLRKRLEVEISKEQYFSKLREWSERDLSNVWHIIQGLENGKTLVGGRVIAIGSTVTRSLVKGQQVKDIDLKVLTEASSSVQEVNQRVLSLISQMGRFEVKNGKVRVLGRLDETKDCLYLYPNNKGVVIHLILSSQDDQPASDHVKWDKLFRKRFSELCRF